MGPCYAPSTMARPWMKSAALLTALLGGATCAKNRCPERVRDLKEIASEPALDRYRGERRLGLEALTRKGVDAASRKLFDDTKLSFVISARPERPLSDFKVTTAALVTMSGRGSVQLCEVDDAPPTLHWSASASIKERDRGLALIAHTPAEDRATVLANELARSDVGKVSECIDFVVHLAPLEREAMLARCVAEELESCGCPAAGGERAHALTTLVLDVYDFGRDCVTVSFVEGADAAQVLIGEGETFGSVVSKLRPLAGRAVRLSARP